MKKSDLLLIIIFILFIGGMLIITYYQYTEKVNECTSDPLKFAVEKIRTNYEAEYVYGSMNIKLKNKLYSWDFGDEIISNLVE